VSESVTQNELNALQVEVFDRSSPNLPASWYCPRRCDHLLFLVEIRNTYVHQTASGNGINFAIALMEKYV